MNPAIEPRLVLSRNWRWEEKPVDQCSRGRKKTGMIKFPSKSLLEHSAALSKFCSFFSLFFFFLQWTAGWTETSSPQAMRRGRETDSWDLARRDMAKTDLYIAAPNKIIPSFSRRHAKTIYTCNSYWLTNKTERERERERERSSATNIRVLPPNFTLRK